MQTSVPLGSQCSLIRGAIPTRDKTVLAGASLTHQTFSWRVLYVSKTVLLPMPTKAKAAKAEIVCLSAGLSA